MTSEHDNTFGGSEGTRDDECQPDIAPPTTNTDDQEMFAYRQFNLHNQSLFPSLHPPAFNHSICYEPEYSTIYAPGAGLPTQPHQFRSNLHYNLSSSFPNMSYTSRNCPSVQFSPFGGTMGQLMMFKQDNSPQMTQPQIHPATFDLSPPTNVHPVLPTTNTPPISLGADHQQYFSPPLWQHHMPTLRIPGSETSAASASEYDDDEDEEGIYDKPYAQLIYEALIQAPGHRLLLRDIYDWFLKNTRKPIESGTNGWQNSIRHNLSMNQAFENDKNDPAASRGARKANSVWVLTDHAIRHGVQSTTRYRKNGTSKKSGVNRTPAVQRQRSGAKGGRAARRAARLKRQEESQRMAKNTQSETDNSVLSSFSRSPISNAQDQWSSYSYSPTTPSDDQFPSTSYSLPHRSYCEYGPEAEPKYEEQVYLDEDERLRQMLSQSTADELFDEIARL